MISWFTTPMESSLAQHESRWKQTDTRPRRLLCFSLFLFPHLVSGWALHMFRDADDNSDQIWRLYIYIERERGELAFNTSEGRVSNVSRVYQKPNLYLLCVPSEAERPAFDAGAVWWCNWWESSEESPTASEEFDYLHPLSAQWAIVRLAICHPFHLHRQHLPCLFMPSRFLGAVFHGGGGREKGWLFLQNALILQVQRTYWAATARLMFNIV